MSFIHRFYIPLLALGMFATAQAETVSLKLKGNPEFVSEAPLEKIVGVADGTLKIDVDFGQLSQLKAVASIPVASMKTGNGIRDDHLKDAEWLNAKKYPNIQFETKTVTVKKSKGDAQKGKAVLIAKGEIMIHGVKKEISPKVSIKWSPKSVQVKTKFEVALADFGVKGAQGVVGKKVGKTIQITSKFKVRR